MVKPGGTLYCYHFDATGHTVALTGANKAIVNKYAYSPFGTIANQKETVAQPFKFVGQCGVITEDNGWYYMRARYYDPKVGRFISEDPMGFDGGDVNLYAYASNNPVMFSDPLGLWTFQIGFGLNSGAGFGTTKSGGIAISYSKSKGFQFGFYGTLGGGGHASVTGDLVMDITFSGNNEISDLSGPSVVTGGGGCHTGNWPTCRNRGRNKRTNK